MTEPKGRGADWTEERGTSDEGRRRPEAPRRREESRVGIVMGSDSDWPVMQAAAAALDEFAVPYEADVVSAHRMPREMIEYGSSAADRGLRVIIAGAGGAAHLPGMLASVTPLPVIGVPVPLANLGGLDSLLSIVQMPAGIPVATVAVGGAGSAACSPSASWPPPRARPPRPGAPGSSPLPGSWPTRPGPRAPRCVIAAPRLRRLRARPMRACPCDPGPGDPVRAIRSGRSGPASLGGGREHRRDAGRGPSSCRAHRGRGQRAHPGQGEHHPGHRARRLRGLRR